MHTRHQRTVSRHPLHRLVRRNFQRRRTVASGVDDQWQADLIDLIQSLCKNSKQERAEDVIFVHGPWSRLCQQAFLTLPEEETNSFFNGTKSRNKLFHRRVNDQNAFASNLAILHNQRHRKKRRRASIFFTILQCNISSQDKTK